MTPQQRLARRPAAGKELIPNHKYWPCTTGKTERAHTHTHTHTHTHRDTKQAAVASTGQAAAEQHVDSAQKSDRPRNVTESDPPESEELPDAASQSARGLHHQFNGWSTCKE
eukprot:371308-Hanusia_phi.AAC.3